MTYQELGHQIYHKTKHNSDAWCIHWSTHGRLWKGSTDMHLLINQQRRDSLGQCPSRIYEIIHSTLQSPITCNCTYPKLHTDHPVLVYKTYKFEWTVLRLFSCLPPQSWIPSPPLWSPLSQSPFLLYPSSCSTSPLSSFGSITFNSKPSLTLTTVKVVSPWHHCCCCRCSWYHCSYYMLSCS